MNLCHENRWQDNTREEATEGDDEVLLPDGSAPKGKGKGKKGKGKAAAKPKGKAKAKAGVGQDHGEDGQLALLEGRDRVKARKFFAMYESLPAATKERYEARHHVVSVTV